MAGLEGLRVTTHNRHLDTARALVAAAAHPSPIDPHDLDCAARLAENARLMLIEAYRLVRQDTVLSIRAEDAGRAARSLRDSAAARFEVVL
jgi:hypothetical protein